MTPGKKFQKSSINRIDCTYVLSDINSSVEDDLWKFVSPKQPLEPEPLKQLQTQPTAGNIRCFAMNDESKYTHN